MNSIIEKINSENSTFIFMGELLINKFADNNRPFHRTVLYTWHEAYSAIIIIKK